MADTAATLYPSLRGVSLLRLPAGAVTQAHHTALGARHAVRRPDAPPAIAPVATPAEAAPASPASRWATPIFLATTVVTILAAAVSATIVGSPFMPGGGGQLWTVLITGLTTGGLSCLAVQGGLLASTLRDARAHGTAREVGEPILAFLVAKVVAYTALGGLLGLFGSVMQLSVTTRGFMQLAIGVFMLATGVRMIYPHPWLRWLALEPPASARRFIRRISKNDETTTPLFLGGLTVLIPCGITQAMMAVAITTEQPLAGAVVMAVFTLATSPVFFSLSFAAASIGRHAERQFTKLVAVLIVILGYVAIQTGAILTGHPLPIRPLFTNLAPATATESARAGTNGRPSARVRVKVDGYEPNRVRFAAGTPGELQLVTTRITGCTRSIAIPGLKIQRSLKVTGTTTISIPAQPAGTELQWVCGMGMFTGTMQFR